MVLAQQIPQKQIEDEVSIFWMGFSVLRYINKKLITFYANISPWFPQVFCSATVQEWELPWNIFSLCEIWVIAGLVGNWMLLGNRTSSILIGPPYWLLYCVNQALHYIFISIHLLICTFIWMPGFQELFGFCTICMVTYFCYASWMYVLFWEYVGG